METPLGCDYLLPLLAGNPKTLLVVDKFVFSVGATDGFSEPGAYRGARLGEQRLVGRFPRRIANGQRLRGDGSRNGLLFMAFAAYRISAHFHPRSTAFPGNAIPISTTTWSKAGETNARKVGMTLGTTSRAHSYRSLQ